MIAIGAKGELCFSSLQMPPEHAGATKATDIVPGTNKTATGKPRAKQRTTTEDQKTKMSIKSKSPEIHACKKPRLEDNPTSSVVRDRKLTPSEDKKREKVITVALYFQMAKIKPDISSVMEDRMHSRMQPAQCEPSKKSPRCEDKKYEKLAKDVPSSQKAKIKPDTSSVMMDRMQPAQYEPLRKSPLSEDKKHEKVAKDVPSSQKAKIKPDTSSVMEDGMHLRIQPAQCEPSKKSPRSEDKKHEKVIKDAPYFQKAMPKIKPDTCSVMRDRMQPVQCKCSRKSPRSEDKKHEKVIKDAPYFQKAMPKIKPDTSSVVMDRMQPAQYEPLKKSPQSEDKKHEKVAKDVPNFQKAKPAIKTCRTQKHSSSEALPYKRARTEKDPDVVDIKSEIKSGLSANLNFAESNCSKGIRKVETPGYEYGIRVVKASGLHQVQPKSPYRSNVPYDPIMTTGEVNHDLSKMSLKEWYRRQRLFKEVILPRMSSVML